MPTTVKNLQGHDNVLYNYSFFFSIRTSKVLVFSLSYYKLYWSIEHELLISANVKSMLVDPVLLCQTHFQWQFDHNMSGTRTAKLRKMQCSQCSQKNLKPQKEVLRTTSYSHNDEYYSCGGRRTLPLDSLTDRRIDIAWFNEKNSCYCMSLLYHHYYSYGHCMHVLSSRYTHCIEGSGFILRA